jgi:hypothetical protein
LDVGTPILLVPTIAPKSLGECVITLPEACLVDELESWRHGFFRWGRASAPAGCSPRGLGEVLRLLRGLLCVLLGNGF